MKKLVRKLKIDIRKKNRNRKRKILAKLSKEVSTVVC